MKDLGHLADVLDAVPPHFTVVFSDGGYPNEFMSYRGYYDMIALDRKESPSHAGELLKKTLIAIGSVFEGYKGGEYRMHDRSVVWVSDYGEASGLGVVAIRREQAQVVLVVEEIEDVEPPRLTFFRQTGKTRELMRSTMLSLGCSDEQIDKVLAALNGEEE